MAVGMPRERSFDLSRGVVLVDLVKDKVEVN